MPWITVTKTFDCGTCDGAGTVPCPTCNGTGSYRAAIGRSVSCPTYSASGKLICERCGGHGKVVRKVTNYRRGE